MCRSGRGNTRASTVLVVHGVLGVRSRERLDDLQHGFLRGAGETLACGTGASAVCVAGVLNGLTEKKILNHLSGGDLELEWADDGFLYMTGPAVEVFSGIWPSQ